jgi:hypothetical protein
MRLEHWLYTIPLRLRSMFRRAQVEQELDEELRFHLEQRIGRELAARKPPERPAMLPFGRWRAWNNRRSTVETQER